MVTATLRGREEGLSFCSVAAPSSVVVARLFVRVVARF
jgi:hypothetical protein